MLAALIFLASTLAADPNICACPSKVVSRVEQLTSGEVVYTYTVTNSGDTPINGVLVGTASNQDAELLELPSGCDLAFEELCACEIAAPDGWTGCVGLQEESNFHFLEFRPKKPEDFLQPGAELVLSVVLPKLDRTYVAPVFWTIAERGCSFTVRPPAESPSR